MSPEPHPRRFGRTPAQAARAALVLTVLGAALLILLERGLLRPGSPLGGALSGAGIEPLYFLLAGIGVVVLIAALGYGKAVRTAERYEITPEGLRVESRSLGTYLLAWDNIREARATATSSLGVKVADREALLATHQGTTQQREWLRTQEPFGEWDFLYPRADLGYPAEAVAEWLKPHLERSGFRVQGSGEEAG
jgi:hypothetical protein